MDRDIKGRTFNFGLRIIDMSQHLPNTRAGNVIGKQVLRSGTSIGANVEEATAACSTNDFAYKMNIALKEARETHYWLRLLACSRVMDEERLGEVIQEADEIKRVLGSIVSKMYGKSRHSHNLF